LVKIAGSYVCLANASGSVTECDDLFARLVTILSPRHSGFSGLTSATATSIFMEPEGGEDPEECKWRLPLIVRLCSRHRNLLQYCSQGKIARICDVSSGLTGIVCRLPVLKHPRGKRSALFQPFDESGPTTCPICVPRDNAGTAHLAAHTLACHLITYSSYNKPW
jgi:hypothetical protein